MEFLYTEQYMLDAYQENGTKLLIFMLGGVQLVGKLLGSDDYTILFEKDKGGKLIIYKSALSTISVFNDRQYKYNVKQNNEGNK